MAKTKKTLDDIQKEADNVNAAPSGTKQASVPNAASEAVKFKIEAAETKRKNHKKLADQKRYPITIAPSYRAHFGNSMQIHLTGILVTIPCNGKTYKVPRDFAMEARRRMRAVDDHDRKSNRLADATSNFEKAPGELKFK